MNRMNNILNAARLDAALVKPYFRSICFTLLLFAVFFGIYTAWSRYVGHYASIPDPEGFLQEVRELPEDQLASFPLSRYLGLGMEELVVPKESAEEVFRRGRKEDTAQGLRGRMLVYLSLCFEADAPVKQ